MDFPVFTNTQIGRTIVAICYEENHTEDTCIIDTEEPTPEHYEDAIPIFSMKQMPHIQTYHVILIQETIGKLQFAYITDATKVCYIFAVSFFLCLFASVMVECYMTAVWKYGASYTNTQTNTTTHKQATKHHWYIH